MPWLLLTTAVMEVICFAMTVDTAIIQKRLIGTACNTTSQCQNILPKSQCMYSSCFCIRGHYYNWKNNSCIPLMLLGENCSHDNECSSHLMCSSQTCACMPGYRQVKDWCEPTQMEDVDEVVACPCRSDRSNNKGQCMCTSTIADTERFMEFPQEQPNLLVVILKGLGIIALKVSLFYLLAKVMCFSCNQMVSQQEYTPGEIYSPPTKPSSSEQAGTGLPYPSTIASSAQYQVPLYVQQEVRFPKGETTSCPREQPALHQPAFPA